MTQKTSKQNTVKSDVKNVINTLLEEVVQMLNKQNRQVVAIISWGNYSKIIKAKGPCDLPRIPFGMIQPRLRKDYYLQIQEYKVINIQHVDKVDSAEVPKWVKLTTGECYNISKDFRTNFLNMLPQIRNFIRINFEKEKRCHIKLFSSKYDL
jgi:hypothetical protein